MLTPRVAENTREEYLLRRAAAAATIQPGTRARVTRVGALVQLRSRMREQAAGAWFAA